MMLIWKSSGERHMSVNWLAEDVNYDELPWLSEYEANNGNPRQPLEVVSLTVYPKGALLFTDCCKAMLWRSDNQFLALFKLIKNMNAENKGTTPIYVKSVGGKRIIIGVDTEAVDPSKCWLIVEDDYKLVTGNPQIASVNMIPLTDPANPTDIGKRAPKQAQKGAS